MNLFKYLKILRANYLQVNIPEDAFEPEEIEIKRRKR